LAIWLCLACGCRANGVGGCALSQMFDHIRTLAAFHDNSYAVLQRVASNCHYSANNLIGLWRQYTCSTSKRGSSRGGSPCSGIQLPRSAKFSMSGGETSNDLAPDLIETILYTYSKILALTPRLDDPKQSHVGDISSCGRFCRILLDKKR
jgi:hypothetical protein